MKKRHHAHLNIGDKVMLLNKLGKSESSGTLEQLGSIQNGHYMDTKHGFGVRDAKDNRIKWVARSEIKKLRDYRRSSLKISG